MTLDELICGFLITKELIISIQILEKLFSDNWEFPQMCQAKELILCSIAVSEQAQSSPICIVVLAS